MRYETWGCLASTAFLAQLSAQGQARLRRASGHITHFTCFRLNEEVQDISSLPVEIIVSVHTLLELFDSRNHRS